MHEKTTNSRILVVVVKWRHRAIVLLFFWRSRSLSSASLDPKVPYLNGKRKAARVHVPPRKQRSFTMIGVLCNGQLYWPSLEVVIETGSVLCRIALWDSFGRQFWPRFPPNFEIASERKDSVPRQPHNEIPTQHWHSFLSNPKMDSSLRAFPGHTHQRHCSLHDLKPVSWPTWPWIWDTDIQMYLQFLFYNQSSAAPSSNGCLSNRENDQRVK